MRWGKEKKNLNEGRANYQGTNHLGRIRGRGPSSKLETLRRVGKKHHWTKGRSSFIEGLRTGFGGEEYPLDRERERGGTKKGIKKKKLGYGGTSIRHSLRGRWKVEGTAAENRFQRLLKKYIKLTSKEEKKRKKGQMGGKRLLLERKGEGKKCDYIFPLGGEKRRWDSGSKIVTYTPSLRDLGGKRELTSGSKEERFKYVTPQRAREDL